MTGAWRAIGVVVGTAWRADRRGSLVVLLLTVLSALASTLEPLWFKLVLDAVLAGESRQVVLISVLAGVTLGILVLTGWLSFTTNQGLQERTNLLMDERLAGLVLRAPGLAHHERSDYADTLALVRAERGTLAHALYTLVTALDTLIRATTTVVLLVVVHPIMLLLPFFGAGLIVAGKKAERLRREAQEATAELGRTQAHLLDLATSAGPAKELRIFGLEAEALARHERLWRQVDRMRTHAAVRANLISAAGWLTFGAGYAAAIVVVADRAVSGAASPGDVLMAISLAERVHGFVQAGAGILTWVLRTLTMVGRYLWLVDQGEAATEAVAATAPSPSRLDRGIELDGVSFRYPGTEADVLSGVSLRLPAGATVAIVGENGAGKTTLIKLLCRFYEPTAGAIRVDDVELRQLDVEEWRGRLSAGFQDFVRFELPVRETVGIGDLPRIENEPAVLSAFARAGASDLPAALPHGLATQLGKEWEGGVELSGGQWQKLALGRAMMRQRPLLLILDEPTASLDAETEHALFAQYDQAARQTAAETGGITLLISHRFSTVQMADLIVVLDGGRVAEIGSHRQLMANRGLYAELYEVQARAYRKGPAAPTVNLSENPRATG